MVDRAVSPARYQIALSIRVNQDSIWPPSGCKFLNHAPGLGIDDMYGIVKQTGRVDQAPVRRHRNVTYEIAMRTARFRHYHKRSRRSELSLIKRELEDACV